MHNFLYIGLKLKDASKCFNRALHAQRLDLRSMNTLVLVGITICYTRTEYLKTCKQHFKRRLHILYTGALISSASLVNKHEKKKRERERALCANTNDDPYLLHSIITVSENAINTAHKG